MSMNKYATELWSKNYGIFSSVSGRIKLSLINPTSLKTTDVVKRVPIKKEKLTQPNRNLGWVVK